MDEKVLRAELDGGHGGAERGPAHVQAVWDGGGVGFVPGDGSGGW